MSKSFRKIASVGLSVSTAVYLFGAAAMPASAQSTSDLQAQIAALLAQINALQAQLAAQTGGSAVSSSYTFTRNLTVGSTGDDVKALQQWLNANGYTVAASGAGSVGHETSYFGPATRAALAKYQAAKGISPAAGYFGPLTRSSLASAGGATGGTGSVPPVTVVPAGTDLVVSLASDTPAARTIGSGTAFNSATKFAFTAGTKAVNITSLTLQKSGFVGNTNINGIDVIDSNGVRHGQVVTSVNADNTMTIVMTSDPIVVPAGSTQYATVRFNLLSGNYNGTVSFGLNSVSSIAADTSAISGAFPLMGNTLNVVNGGNALASTTLDVLTSTGSSTLNVDPNSSQEITKFRIQETGSQEGVYLYSLMLYNYGNANASDYKDVTLEAQDGTVLATAQPNGQYVTFNLASPYFIDKGLTKDFTVKAKLVGGTTKTIKLVVYNNYDIDLRGASTGVSVIPGAGSNDASFPIGNAYNQTTIGSGTITLTRASDSPSSAVAPGSSQVLLAKYNAKPNGENYELRQVSFYIATSSTGIDLTGTVYVKVNGSIVYSTGASNVSNTAATTFTLSSYPILTAGVDNVITIEASAIPSNSTSADSYTVTDFNLEQVKRLVSNDILSNGDTGLTTSDTDALTVSVNTAALTVSTLATPAANSVVVGTTGYEFATFELNAQGGGEDVKVSTIVVSDGAGANYTDVANLQMYKDNATSPLTTTASTATNAATVTFTFSTPIVVTRSTPITLHLKGDAVTGTSTHTFKVASSTSAVTATGATTGNTLTNGSDITFTGSGQGQTLVASGNLTVALVSGSGATPSKARVMTAGSTGQTLLAFTIRSQYETQKITSLKITASSTSGGSLATSTIQNLKLYEGNSSTPFAQASNFSSCASGVCTYTWTANDNLLSAPVPTTGVTIYVKGDVVSMGNSIGLGDTFAVKVASTTDDIAIKGAITGSTSGTKSGTAGFGDTMYFTYVVPQSVAIEAVSPTSAQSLGSSGNGAAAGQQLAVFKVTNNGSAAVRLSTSTTFRFAQAGTTTSTFKVYIGDSAASANTALNSSATSTQANYFQPDISAAAAADRTINGGATKYLVIKNEEVMVTGTTAQFSADAIGDLSYQVDEGQLGYDINGDGDSSDVVQDLPITGMPQVVSPSTAL